MIFKLIEVWEKVAATVNVLFKDTLAEQMAADEDTWCGRERY